MIANLFELGQGGQNKPFALDAFSLLQLLSDVFDHGFVQGGLLFGEIAEELLLHFVRQIFDDRLVGLNPPQNEGFHEFL